MEQDYKIIDNFLDDKDYHYLKNIILDDDFPWRFRSSTTNQEHKKDKGFFTYNFYENFKNDKNLFESIIIPILHKLNATSVIQTRANLILTDLLKERYLTFHNDYGDNNMTAIFNFTDSDGGTVLKINDKYKEVLSKENRMLIFKGSIPHTSIKPTNVDRRYILNINYFI